MSIFGAALHALNLSQADAAELLGNKIATIKDWSAGRSRVPDGAWRQLGDLFEQIEAAADEIIADQGELDGGKGVARHQVLPAMVPIGHPALREAAIARAMLVLGPLLLEVAAQPVA